MTSVSNDADFWAVDYTVDSVIYCVIVDARCHGMSSAKLIHSFIHLYLLKNCDKHSEKLKNRAGRKGR